MRQFSWAALAGLSICLSGCLYYPFTYHALEADHLQKPFKNCWMVSDPGNLSLSIGGSGYNLGKLRVENASFTRESGRPIPIDRIVYDQIYGNDFAIVKFFYKPGTYVDGEPFEVSLLFDAQGSKLRMTGKFSTHSHTKIEYLPEVLDHG